MIGKCALTAFLATSNPRRAKAFYTKTLGLRLVDEDKFALVFDAAGVPLRIQKVSEVRPLSLSESGAA
jgi:catechol 2,3-dioxygenase-like lactoylglutathione lyase family enzyme